MPAAGSGRGACASHPVGASRLHVIAGVTLAAAAVSVFVGTTVLGLFCLAGLGAALLTRLSNKDLTTDLETYGDRVASQKYRSALGALALLWTPTIVGMIAMIVLRGLYGVAVLFGGYAVIFVVLGRSGRGLYWAWALTCLVVAILLVTIQSQL